MVANAIAVPAEVLYETDFVEWTEEMARLIENRETVGLDWDHLAEEIRDLGISQRNSVSSHLEVLLRHLIKWEIQPSRRGRSWEDSIANARHQIDFLLHSTPSLRRHFQSTFESSYHRAARQATRETHLPPSTPFTHWSPEQVLDPGFLPE
jgi:hypothetical protein